MALRKSASLGGVLFQRAVVFGGGGWAGEHRRRERIAGTHSHGRASALAMTSSVIGGRVHTRLQVQFHSTSSQHHPGKRHEKDLYAVMGVTPHATQQQVKEAYYRLSMKYHPDRNGGSEVAHEKFTELTEAYSVLGNYTARRKYDKGLLHKYPRRPHPQHHQSHGQSTTAQQGQRVMFDFDEFYRMHYGEALRRDQQKMRERRAAREKARLRTTLGDTSQQMLVVSVALAVLLVGGAWVRARTPNNASNN